MRTVEIGGRSVEVDVAGRGDPVLFVHARPFASWYAPLVAELDDHTTIVYRRPVGDPDSFSIEGDAALVSGLLAELGIDRPHVVGHSYGGLLALELARQGEVRARSLALLEPAAMGLVEPAEAASRAAGLLELARTAGPVPAMEAFLQAVCGPDGQGRLDELVPGAAAEAAAHAPGFFTAELPAVVRWSFGAEDAADLDVPILNVVGGDSAPRFAESAAIIHEWFPGAAPVAVAGATHLLVAQAPGAIARQLREHWRDD
ncbi:MAG: alpha/beta fold hydrolase [Ilumatobacteraceae bacterium]